MTDPDLSGLGALAGKVVLTGLTFDDVLLLPGATFSLPINLQAKPYSRTRSWIAATTAFAA